MTQHRSSYHHPPLAVQSVDGRFRLTTTARREEHERRVCFFFRVRRMETVHTYVMSAVEDSYRDGRDVTRWRSELRCTYPKVGWVDCDGSAAVLHADDTLVFFGSDGRVAGSANVLDRLCAERRDYVGWSTAGQFWDRYPMGFFASTPEGARFCFRLRKGGRLVFDASTGAPIADDPGRGAIADAERRWILDGLERGPAGKDDETVRALIIAAGQERLAEAVPLLLAIERRPMEPDPAGYDAIRMVPDLDALLRDEKESDDQGRIEHTVPVANWCVSRVRAAAQHALARLGVDYEPRNAWVRGGQPDGPRPTGWREAALRIAVGDAKDAVYAACGAPSYFGFGDRGGIFSEYDVFVDGAYRTVRVDYDHDVVRSVETLAPPPWQHATYRDEWMFW